MVAVVWIGNADQRQVVALERPPGVGERNESSLRYLPPPFIRTVDGLLDPIGCNGLADDELHAGGGSHQATDFGPSRASIRRSAAVGTRIRRPTRMVGISPDAAAL